LWETRRIAGSSPTTVVNNDVISHRTNPLDPVFSPFLAYVPVLGIAMFVQVICQAKTARFARLLLFPWGQYS
jgi:hypothetical protein